MFFKNRTKEKSAKNKNEKANSTVESNEKRRKHRTKKNSDEKSVVESLNISYQAAEQSRSNYYWVSNWRNAFFELLGISENLDRTKQYITNFFATDKEERKEYFSGAILDRKQHIDRALAKNSLRKHPPKIELKDVFEELNIPKATESEKVKNYIANQEKCFAKYADDSVALRVTQAFILAFLQFWEDSSPLLEKKDEKNYDIYMNKYTSFQETDAYKQFVNEEGDDKNE